MPPKSALKGASKGSLEKAPKATEKSSKRSKEETEGPPPKSADHDIRIGLIEAFHEVQKSSSSHTQQRKKVLKLRSELNHPAPLSSDLALLAIAVISTPSISIEAVNRVVAFIKELLIEMRKVDGNDDECVRIIETVIPVMNAYDKSLRQHVVGLMHGLLESLDPKIRRKDRSELLEKVATQLKYRIHDKSNAVAERAIKVTPFLMVPTLTDDITQHLLGLLCTSEHAGIRAAVVTAFAHNQAPSDEIVHHIVRCLSDRAPAVRKAAWDALGKLKWNRFNAYVGEESLRCLLLGVRETLTAVKSSVATTILSSWLSRDCENCVSKMLGSVDLGAANTVDTVIGFLMSHVKRVAPAKCKVSLDLSNMTTANTLLWRMSFETDEENKLEIEDFASIFNAIGIMLSGKDAPKNVKIQVADIDNQGLGILEQFLHAIPIYHRGGYLTTASEKVRQLLRTTLSILIAGAPDGDPCMMVDACIRAFHCLVSPEDTIENLKNALEMLHRNLGVVITNKVCFDDVEAYLQAENRRVVPSGKSKQAQDVKRQIEIDSMFLMRMGYIVHSWLSMQSTKVAIPAVFLLTLKLCRETTLSPKVNAQAVRSTALVCLHNKETVSTFLAPLQQGLISPHSEVANSCYEAIMDVMCEYGATMFLNVTKKDSDSAVRDKEAAAKVQYDALCEEIVKAAEKNDTARAGLCKLLSCGRIRLDDSQPALVVVLNALGHLLSLKPNAATTVELRTIEYYHTFLMLYAHSHPTRMKAVASASVKSLQSYVQKPTLNRLEFKKFLGRILIFVDAANLPCVRALDPEASTKSVARIDTDVDSDDESPNLCTPRKSMQSAFGRSIAKELSKCSCHETILQALLIEMVCTPAIAKVVLPELVPAIRLYKMDKTVAQQLLATAARCQGLSADLARFLSQLTKRVEKLEAEDDINSTGSRSVAEGPRTVSVMSRNDIEEGVEALINSRIDDLDHHDLTQATNNTMTQQSTVSVRSARSVSRAPRGKTKADLVEIDIPTSQEDAVLSEIASRRPREALEEEKSEGGADLLEVPESEPTAKKGKKAAPKKGKPAAKRGKKREAEDEEEFVATQE